MATEGGRWVEPTPWGEDGEGHGGTSQEAGEGAADCTELRRFEEGGRVWLPVAVRPEQELVGRP